MAERTDELRRELAKTRQKAGRTMSALADKVDIGGRAKRQVRSTNRRTAGSRSRRRSTRSNSEDLKWGIAAAGFAGGLLLGTLLPRTQSEDEAVGPLSDQLKRPVKRAARKVRRKTGQATQRGRQVARKASRKAVRTARKTTRTARKTTRTARKTTRKGSTAATAATRKARKTVSRKSTRSRSR